jgi:hypothetical protein
MNATPSLRGFSRLSLGASLLASAVTLNAASGQNSDRATAGQAEAYALSVPVRDLKLTEKGATVQTRSRINPLAGEPDAGKRGTWNRPPMQPAPLGESSPNPSGRTPALDRVFDGTANPAACGGCSPPDTNGDVGKSHYIQMVNVTKVAIYNKSGTLLKPAFNLGSLWPSGPCASDAGDPIVRYDPMADRWLLSQFANPTHLCFAVSKTADPLGAYHLFTFNVGAFPDYFKLGVWPNGYYVSANEATYTAYAFNRTKMLAGNQTAGFIKFTGQTNFLMPADVDGSALPTGSGLFYTFKDDVFHGGADRIELFRLTPNFSAGTGTFQLIKSLPIAPFTYTVCGFFNLNCIPQKGTATRVDAVSEWPMQRLAYRKFDDHEALVGNFTVGGGHGAAGAAIRWFELRKTTGNWTLYQQGTHDPDDGRDRFMGSIAMDKMGNIALGYSISGTTLNPGIRYATRPASAPLGAMSLERIMRAGAGSQTGSNRWGDYSAMAVDPITDCQFWYTNEYYSVNSASNWKTSIGAFTMPDCH